MPKPIYHVFNYEYPGISRELSSEAEIEDPLSGNKTLLRRAIWDTGATQSMIHEAVAQRLGLIPTGKAVVHTANGQRVVSTYVIKLILPHSRVVIAQLNVSEGPLGNSTDMLIGMDVIAIGDFTVQNYNGKTHFSFCYPPFENKYGMIEKADKHNRGL